MKDVILFVVGLLAMLFVLFAPIGVDAEAIDELMKVEEVGIIHEESLNNWKAADSKYLTGIIDSFNKKEIEKEDLLEIIRKENKEILVERNTVRTKFVNFNGAKVWGPYTVEKIHLLETAYENRIKIASKLFKNEHIDFSYNGNIFKSIKSYKVQREIEGDIDYETLKLNAKDTLDILANYHLPYNLYDELDIVISPYKLKEVNGYIETFTIEGREEVIVLANNRKSSRTFKETFLHELGHVFMFDVAGKEPYLEKTSNYSTQDLAVWDSYQEMYPDLDYNENPEHKRSPIENMAEDFKDYYMYSNGYEKTNRIVEFDYNKDFEKFMEDNLEGYNKRKKKRISSLEIKTMDSDVNFSFGQHLDLLLFDNEIEVDKNSKNEDKVLITLIDSKNNAFFGKIIDGNVIVELPSEGEYQLVMMYRIDDIDIWAGNLNLYFHE